MSARLGMLGAVDVVTFDWVALAPALAPAAAAVLLLVLDALVPLGPAGPLKGRGHRIAEAIAALGLAAGAGAALAFLPVSIAAVVVGGAGPRDWGDAAVRTLCLPAPDGACLWTAGRGASTLQAAILGAALVALVLLPRVGGVVPIVLLLTSATGGTMVAASNDLGSWLVGLELATIPVVALVALRGSRAAGHGALSLLMTSLVSFALLVLGSALWLTATGDAAFSSDTVEAAWGDEPRRAVLVLAVLVLLAGVGFKLSLVPFHAWTPQAYASADLGVTALLAGASKISALAALLVVIAPFGGLVGAATEPSALVWGLSAAAVSSMLLGNLLALRQNDPVRLLAWSTVGQAGWVVLPLVALDPAGARAASAYVITYAVATLTTLAAVLAVRARAGRDAPDEGGLPAYRGLLRRDPLVGAGLALALLVLAGLPPGIIGLVTKVVVLTSVVGAQLWPLAVLAVLAAVLGIAVYLRWFGLLLARDDTAPDANGQAGSGRRHRRARLVVLAGTALLVVLSALPQLLLGLLA